MAKFKINEIVEYQNIEHRVADIKEECNLNWYRIKPKDYGWPRFATWYPEDVFNKTANIEVEIYEYI